MSCLMDKYFSTGTDNVVAILVIITITIRFSKFSSLFWVGARRHICIFPVESFHPTLWLL